MRVGTTAFALLAAATFGAACAADAPPEPPISLAVDASEAPRRIFHVSLEIPAKPGPLRLLYPKWIPGEHAPTGPIADVAGLRIAAAGREVRWTRDPADMYAFQCTVPEGAASVGVSFDYLSPAVVEGFSSSASATETLALISWNQMLLYPDDGRDGSSLTYAAKLTLPPGWKTGTALRASGRTGDVVAFETVPMTSLIDSPVLTGRYMRDIVLMDDPRHVLHVAADGEAALAIPADLEKAYENLVREALALFGARAYREYHFLLTLSDHVAHFGLEHHESSDNRLGERYFLDDDVRRLGRELLSHEFVHSWNGKYRRPADLTRDDFHKPIDSRLLWVYEGLTQYLGDVLSARSGLWDVEQFHEQLALAAGEMESRRGRTWRPLEDTTVAAQLLYEAPEAWRSWRRSVDFYDESALVWLEVDAIIRTRTQGKRSLDDFVRAFHGTGRGRPEVKTYTFDDVVGGLQDVLAYDWRGFFEARIRETNEHAPTGGLAMSGWKLGLGPDTPKVVRSRKEVEGLVDLTWSLGFSVDEKTSGILDVVPGAPAAAAGVGPGMFLVAVDGRRFTPEVLDDAVRGATGPKRPLQLLVRNGEYFRTFDVSYHEGPRYPRLERDAGKPDLLATIGAPRAPAEAPPMPPGGPR